MTRNRLCSGRILPLTGLILAAGLLSGCGEGDRGKTGPTGEAGPTGPVISSLSMIGAPVFPGGQVEILVSANSVSDEAVLSYEWDVPAGWLGESDSELLVLTAPEEQAARGTVTVRVSDGERETRGSLLVATRGPAIEAFSVGPLPAQTGEEITFAVSAYNRDGHPLHYHYDIGGGLSFENQGPEWSWTVARQAMGGSYQLQAIVEDSINRLSATAATYTELESVSQWAGFGGDRQRTGRSRSATAPAAPESTDDLLWSYSAGSNLFSSPAIGADGTLYVGSGDGHLYALRPDPGLPDDQRVRWVSEDTGDLVWSSPVIGVDGTIYVGSESGAVFAFDGADGGTLWRFSEPTAGVFSSPAIGADGTLYVGSRDGRFYALDPNPDTPDEARLLWSYDTGQPFNSSPAIGADGTVYVGSSDQYLYAFDPNPSVTDEERVLWRYKTDGAVWSPPAIDGNGIIYVGSHDRHLYALDSNPALADDERLLWRFESGDLIAGSPAIGSDGTIYVASIDHRIYALSPEPGLAEEERVIWAFTTDGELRSSPTLGADGIIYVGSRGGTLYALYPEAFPANGLRVKWQFQTGDQANPTPAISANGTVYAGSRNGNIFAFGKAVEYTVGAFTATVGDAVEITQSNATGETILVKIVDAVTGAEVHTEELASGDTLKLGLEAGDYTVLFSDSYTAPSFDAGIQVISPIETGAFTAATGDVVEITQTNTSGAPVYVTIVDAASGDTVHFEELASAGSNILRHVGLNGGEYDVYFAGDADIAEFAPVIEVIPPEVISDFEATYTGTANESRAGTQRYYLIAVDETTSYEVTLTKTDGAGWARFWVYRLDNDEADRSGELSSNNTSFTATVEFAAGTHYIVRVGNDYSTFSEPFEYQLTLEEQ